MDVVTTLPQELMNEFLGDKALENLKKYGKIAVNETIKHIPRDNEGNIYKKKFFLGNFCIRFRIF